MKPPTTPMRSHQQQVEDVDGGRAQVRAPDRLHHERDRLRDEVRGAGGERAVGERRVRTLRTGDEAAGEHADDDHDVEDEHGVARVVVDDDRADDAGRHGENERGERAGDEPLANRWSRLDPHGQPTGPNGLGRPSLPGLRMPFGSSACFNGDEHVEGRAERLGDEPASG